VQSAQKWAPRPAKRRRARLFDNGIAYEKFPRSERVREVPVRLLGAWNFVILAKIETGFILLLIF